MPAHRAPQVNFRICDYNPQTASPESNKGCGEHTDYGTFSIIFQMAPVDSESRTPAQMTLGSRFQAMR